jgi:heme/copper-type cytochrome/quinol oxidase subunit 4
MAKRRKEGTEEEEQFDFQIPKFDEEAFIKKERRNIKTMVISFLFGLLIAVICFGFWVVLNGSFVRWELVLLVAVINAIWIKYLFLRLNIDLTEFGRKGWASAFATYFFTWLIVLIVLVNPPFYDAESPHIDMVVLPSMQEPGGTVLILANIVDNVGINKAGINLTIVDPNGTSFSPQFTYKNNTLQYTYDNPKNLTGTFNYSLTTIDVNNFKTTTTGSFSYNTTALEIISSRSTGLMSGDAITIKADQRINTENFRVYYTINNGTQLNVSRKDPADKEKYDTTTEYKGWTSNTTVSIHVFAEASHYFVNNPTKFSNIVQDTHVYTMSTGNDSNIGTKPPLQKWNYTLTLKNKPQPATNLNYPLPTPISIGATPGFELLITVVALLVVVLLFKRKKKKT